jgi:hypothetical protein
MSDRYFFAQDDDSHWYMVPASRRAEWDAWQRADYSDEYDIAAEANGWRTGGGIEGYTFADPREDR